MSRTRLPELLEDAEDGEADLSFRVVDQARTSDGRLAVTAAARFDGGRVGLQIVLESGEASFRSIGGQSDRLLRAMAAAYGLDAAESAMKDEVKFTAVALDGDPTADPPQALQFKLLFEPGGAGGYAEVYANIDLSEARVEIREKDQEYRRPLLAALAAAAARPARRAPRAPAEGESAALLHRSNRSWRTSAAALPTGALKSNT